MNHDLADQSMKRKSENSVEDGARMVVERARKVFSALLPLSRLPRTEEEVIEMMSELLQFDVHTLIDLEVGITFFLCDSHHSLLARTRLRSLID